jgi:hypothetical protein
MFRERAVLGVALAMIGAIALFNMWAPATLRLNHLYSVPVLLVAWRVGLKGGMMAAGFSEIGLIASVLLSRDATRFSHLAWNGASMLLSLVVIAWIIGHLHRYFRNRNVPVEMFRRQTDAGNPAVMMHVCAWCHKVKNPGDRWVTLESYLGVGGITHGICPTCKRDLIGIEPVNACVHPYEPR